VIFVAIQQIHVFVYVLTVEKGTVANVAYLMQQLVAVKQFNKFIIDFLNH